MSHEIEKTDGLALVKEKAWHGLGLVVPDHFTPREGLKLAGLEWGVSQKSLYFKDANGKDVEVPSHVLNFREDTQEQFAVVSSGYQVISNAEMADFCEALAMNEKHIVKCETVGSVQGGRRVWFLLKGKEFAVAKGDEMFPYILVSNAHDGSAAFRVTPTTVRTVCSNTLHLTIPRHDTGELGTSALSIRHTKNLMERVEEAKHALRHYQTVLQENRNMMETLASKPANKQNMQEFFIECYQEMFGEIPSNPSNRKEERQHNKAKDAYHSFTRRFDDERHIAGDSYWNVFNAFSGLCQHDMKSRGSDDADRLEKRVNSNLFGLNATRTHSALQLAYQKAM